LNKESKLNKGHKTFDFDKEIRKHEEGFRQKTAHEKALLNKMLEESDRRASTDPSLGIKYLLETVIDFRDALKSWLRNRFGYEVPPLGIKTTTARFVIPERVPGDPSEIALFVILLGEAAAKELALNRMGSFLKKITCLDKDTYQAMRKECIQGLRAVHDLQVGMLLALSNSYTEGHLADVLKDKDYIAWFAGSLKAQIKMYERLKLSLEELGGSADSRLLKELPAVTLIELDEIVQEGSPPTELRNHVANHLANMRQRPLSPEQREKLVASDRPDSSPRVPLSQEFLAKEEFQALVASANLAERQRQILELQLEGKHYREIADELEITEGTVKSTMYDVREKLRQAAGQ
jgi:RNA polymerase sigma factor (sigma-70 family)